MLTLLIIGIALALILIAQSSSLTSHPFLALFVGAIIYGLDEWGMSSWFDRKVDFSDGFGGVWKCGIGLIFAWSDSRHTFLEKTGGAMGLMRQRKLLEMGLAKNPVNLSLGA